MRFMSLTRVFDGKQRATQSLMRRRDRGVRRGTHRWISPLRLETLEDRTLLAVIPPAQLTALNDVSNGGSNNQLDPVVVVSPRDPNDMVAFWLNHIVPPNPVLQSTQDTLIQGARSINGGNTWGGGVQAPLNFLDPTIVPNPQGIAFPRVSKPSIAIDRGTGAPTNISHVYVVYAQYSADYSLGVLVMQRYDFNGVTGNLTLPMNFTNKILARWYNQGTGGEGGLGFEAVYNPVVVVDNTVSSYDDPQGPTQTNPNVDPTTGLGVVYVAWNTNYAPFEFAPASYQGNTVKVIASADGGSTFSTEKFLHDVTYAGGDRMSSPRLAVSQGKMFPDPNPNNPDVAAGQLTAVWDNFRHVLPPPPNQPDVIMSNRIKDGGVGVLLTSNRLLLPPPTSTCSSATAGFMCDAVDPGTGNHTPGVSVYKIDVTNANFGSLFPTFGTEVTGLSVTLNIESVDCETMKAELIPPSDSGLGTVTLFQNNTDAAGTAVDGRGICTDGDHVGLIKPDPDVAGTIWDTVFDFGVPRRINDPTSESPYTAHFRPEVGDLPQEFTVDNATGEWRLKITKFRASSEMPPVNNLLTWNLRFTGRLTPEAETAITLLPPLPGPYGLRGGIQSGSYLNPPPTWNPFGGIASTPVIASDNTLGAFSPFQGRLYVAFTDTDFNISLYTSDDGGESWDYRGIVNDDNGLDGYSEGTRAQFHPSIAVDNHTGTLVVSFLDNRYDASNRRYVNTVTASIDGGFSFNKQPWLNPSLSATDTVTGNQIVLQPIPGNQSDGNEAADQVFGLGDNQGLAVAAGKIYAVWGHNNNGGRAPDDVNDPNTFAPAHLGGNCGYRRRSTHSG